MILGIIIFLSAVMLIPAIGNQSAFAFTTTSSDAIPSPSKTVDFTQFSGDFSHLCNQGVDWCFTSGPVEVGDLDGAKEVAKKLKSKKFYDLCSNTITKRFEQNYTEKKWKENWRITNGK